MSVVNIREKIKAKKSAEEKQIDADDFDLDESPETGKELSSETEKQLEVNEDFDIVEIPALTVKQYVIITIALTCGATVFSSLMGLVISLLTQ